VKSRPAGGGDPRGERAGPAQDPPPLPGGPPLTAEEAVVTAFRHDPQLATAAAGVDGRAAVLAPAEGLFSSLTGVNTRLDYIVGELFGSRLKGEQDRRLRIEIPPPILDDVAQSLIDRAPVASATRSRAASSTRTAPRPPRSSCSTT